MKPLPTEQEAVTWLREHLGKQGQIVLPQVRNGTGHTRTTRTADAIVVETWPSRGQSFTGVEYKRSRSDFLMELKHPAKAEEIGKYCKFWTVLTPHGLVDPAELPELWGLWEIQGKRLLVTKPAPARECVPPSVGFVCAMLRANRDFDPSRQLLMKARDQAHAELNDRHQEARQRERKQFTELSAKVHAFERATGLSIQYGDDSQVALEIVRHLKNPDVMRTNVERHHHALLHHLGTYEQLLRALTDDDD